MKFGFTTGSCAAAGAKAAAYMLLTGKIKEKISILTPKGLVFNAAIVDIARSEKEVSCAVIKDGGDDPDVTTGAHIVSKVSFLAENRGGAQPYIKITGGKGVGLVTKPGLDQRPGDFAINHVPRSMIEKEVLEVCGLCGYDGGLAVQISVPEGEELAEKTFNPRLGIKGGISILGTSGIVEPMSAQALKDTIKVELNQQKALGYAIAAVSPGNYGIEFMRSEFGFDLDKSVKCSNFIGDTIDMAADAGFKKMLLTGHIGKLVKLSGGMMNTHSREGDCRMELMAAAAVKSGCKIDDVRQILDCVSTEEACRILKKCGKLEKAMSYLMERIMFYLDRRAGERIEIGCMVYCNEFGLLCKSENASDLLKECMMSEEK